MKRSIYFILCAAFVLVGPTLASAQREIKTGIVNGRAIKLPKPEYTAEAKAAKIEGVVYIEVLIDEQGNVISAQPASLEQLKVYKKDGSTSQMEQANPLLVESAQRAAMQAKFSPMMENPVKVRGIIAYNFVADESLKASSTGEVSTKGINGGVLNGKAISLPKPEYAPAARAVRADGAVSVKVTIDEQGTVEAAEAVSGHPLLRASAVDAARGAKFSPTQLNGSPVKVTGVIVYNFVAPAKE